MFYYIICRTDRKPICLRAYSQLFKYKTTACFTQNSTALASAPPKSGLDNIYNKYRTNILKLT